MTTVDEIYKIARITRTKVENLKDPYKQLYPNITEWLVQTILEAAEEVKKEQP